jgi:hypothetical protein
MRYFIIASAIAAGVATMATSRPASAQPIPDSVTWHVCTGASPPANEVYVYANTNFGGACAGLSIGFYQMAGNFVTGFGLADNTISSMKVGTAARARVFNGSGFTSNWTHIGAGQSLATMPSGWDNAISSIRVENAARSTVCSDLVQGEFALFREASFTGDCVVLRYGYRYLDQGQTGIANDSVTSVNAGPALPGCTAPYTGLWQVCLYVNPSNQGTVRCFTSGRSDATLVDNGINEQTSSVSTGTLCIF